MLMKVAAEAMDFLDGHLFQAHHFSIIKIF